MAQELKHVGRLIANNKKCLVAYRTLPGDSANALIILTENLTDIYHNALMNLVESPAAQSAYEFAEVLARSQFPDGSTMLPMLHAQGRLTKIGTSDVEMTPTTSFSIPLSELNQLIAEQRGVTVDQLALREATEEKKQEPAPQVKSKVKSNPDGTSITEPTVAEATPATAPAGTPEDQAKFYRSQADKLAKEAAAMRRMAEELVPTAKKKQPA